jgi:hypothetical protein
MYLLIYAHEAKWTPFQTHCYSENLAALGIEPETSVVCSQELRPGYHRGGRMTTTHFRNFI